MSSNHRLDLDLRLGFDPEYLPKFEENLFIEGPRTARRLTNFFALLLFATIIATYGVTSDSSTTVIGAMLVAPLMTPIIATTAAVVMGSTPRALRAFALTIAGAVLVICIAYLLTWVIPDATISFTENDEISSRTNPGLYALVTALGAGAAGAFITSRAEISDAIGGVAIAVALAPPLCVIGISLQQGQWDAASGAFLLFLTNYLATLLARGLVLMVVGLYKQGIMQGQAQFRRAGLLVFIVGILVISIPLAFTTYSGLMDLNDESNATLDVQTWLEDTTYVVESVEVNDNLVVATVDGSGELPDLQELANQLAGVLNGPVTVDLRIIRAIMSNSSFP